MSDARLTVHIKNKDPIELGELADSFTALGAQFAKHVQTYPGIRYPFQAKLYVKELKSGSIIAELVTFGVPAMVMAGGINTVFDFGNRLKSLFEFFLTPRSQRPAQMIVDKVDCDNVQKMLRVTQRDSNGSINFIAQENSSLQVTINVDSVSAAKIVASAGLEKNRIEQPLAHVVERVVLHLYQVRNELKNKTGDKGIIETISPKPIKLLFPNEEIKTKIIEGDGNQFKFGYQVTVQVEKIEDWPIAYKILELHEKFEIE